MGATTDPRLSPAAQRLAGIQNLSQALRRTGATLSGDPQRMALQAQEDERLRQRRLATKEKAEAQKILDVMLKEGTMTKSMYDLASRDPERYAGFRLQAMEQQRLQDIKTQEITDKKDSLIDQLVEDGMLEAKARAAVEGIPASYFPPESVAQETAAQRNLKTFNKIQETGTPEEIAVAREVLIGTKIGKSKEQLKKELIFNLAKQVNVITGEPLSEDDINDRIKIIDRFYPKSNNEEVFSDGSLSFEVPGYEVKEILK